MQDFRKVVVWQKAHELALRIHELTFDFPKEEQFGLRSTIRRISAEIPAKIAQGCNAPQNADFLRHLQTDFGNGGQLEYYLLLARDLKLFTNNEYEQLNEKTVEVKKMLQGYMQKLIPNS
jgi:four helix bundle protein